MGNFWLFSFITSGIFIIVSLVYIFIFGGLGAWLADKKGYSAGGWFFICLLTGPVGLIALAGAPSQYVEMALDEIKKQLASKPTNTTSEKIEGIIKKDEYVKENYLTPYIVLAETEIKEEPDANANAIMSVNADEVADFLSDAYEDVVTKSVWYKVKYKQTEGWCLAKNLRKYTS